MLTLPGVPKLLMDITTGYKKNFSLNRDRQNYPILNLKYQNPDTAEGHGVSAYLREPWEKGTPENPREEAVRAPQRL